MGFPYSPDGLTSSTAETVFEALARLNRDPDNNHVPSMLHDARRSQPMEVEVIVGEVVRMGKEYKVDMPVSVIPPIIMGRSRLTLRSISTCCTPFCW